jgi:hypothetical protein
MIEIFWALWLPVIDDVFVFDLHDTWCLEKFHEGDFSCGGYEQTRGEQMDEQIDTFFAEATEAFAFLERDYGYQHLEGDILYPEELRDKTALSRYVASQVGVEIAWSIADADIDVIFVELVHPYILPRKISRYSIPGAARAIGLFSLAQMRGVLGDPNFLLAYRQKARSWKKSKELIETRRKEILEGLARATQRYASTIVQGDTSMFTEAMEYLLAQQKQNNPDFFIPGPKQQNEPPQHDQEER